MAVKVMASSVMNASHKDRASGGDAESTAVIPPLDWRRDARSRGGLPQAQQVQTREKAEYGTGDIHCKVLTAKSMI